MQQILALTLLLAAFSAQAGTQTVRFGDVSLSDDPGNQESNCDLFCAWDAGSFHFEPEYPTWAAKERFDGNKYLVFSKDTSGAILKMTPRNDSDVSSFSVLAFDILLLSDRQATLDGYDGIPLGDWHTVTVAEPTETDQFVLRAYSNGPDSITAFIDNIVVDATIATRIKSDVDPWGTTNTVLPNSDNSIVVAVLGSNTGTGDPVDFDATQVNPATLKLGNGQAPNIAAAPWIADFDGDTNTDAAFVFQTQASGIQCNATQVTLVGETFDGSPFKATDSIDASDCVTGSCHPH